MNYFQKNKFLLPITIFVFLNIMIFSAFGPKKESIGTSSEKLPNIIIFYVDDLGYGDVGYNGAVGVKTPMIDKLAKEGIVFTDAHSTAATCTPSRYSLLTGKYAFRNKVAILPGDAPMLIKPGSFTLPSMLRKAGYATGVIGKWHLGLGNGNINWNKHIKPGPAEIGFDYSFILPATGDRVPTVYLENQRVLNANPNDPIEVNYELKLDGYHNGIDNPELLKQGADKQHSNTITNGISRIGYMKGGETALWVDEEFPNVLKGRANQFINQHKDKPFFLFFSYHDIHVPRLPNKKFVDASSMGPRGDAIAQMDWVTGEVLNEIKKLGLDDNTIVIFTSDNGPVLNDGYDDKAVQLLGNHKPAGSLRGGKYSAYEGGTRVPTIIRWYKKIKPQVSNALVSQVDFYASIATLLNHKMADNEAIDSENLWTTFLGKETKGRKYLLEESYTYALRFGNWKYIEPLPAQKSLPNFMANKGSEGGFKHTPQLFDIKTDIGEKTDLSDQNINLVKEMNSKLNQIKVKNKRD